MLSKRNEFINEASDTVYRLSQEKRYVYSAKRGKTTAAGRRLSRTS